MKEGNWVARFDLQAGVFRTSSSPESTVAAGVDSDAIVVADGGIGLLLAGAVDGSRDLEAQARTTLASYRRRGEALLGDLRGRFAAVIWDCSERRLLAARDPMGTYPLFFGRSGREIFLSPSIERLLELGPVPSTVSRVALAEHLCHRWHDKQQTYFEALRRLPAGHILSVRQDTEDLKRCWDPGSENGGDGVDWLGEDDITRFGDLLDRAVARMAASERFGIFLSGGLDSASIATRLATRDLPGGRALALSLDFDHPDCDELAGQTTIACALGFEHEIQTVSVPSVEPGPLARAAALSSSWPVPLMNVWNGEFHRLAKIGRQRRCDVVLTGSGGDDWLGVSPYHAADLLKGGRLASLARLTGTLRSSYSLSSTAAARLVLWSFGLRPLLRHALYGKLRSAAPRALDKAWHRRVLGAIPPWLAPDRALREQLVERAQPPSAPPGESFYVREMRRGLDHPLLAVELEESFELGRRVGSKILHPFFDPDLVEFLYRLPPRLLLGEQGPDRWLVRETLAESFPELGFESLRKSDARAFFGVLARKEGARLWSSLGGAKELGRLGIVDRQGVEAAVEGILKSGDSKKLFRLWDLINLESWLRSRAG